MAFVAANSHYLTRELWPGGLGKLSQDKHLGVQNLPSSRVVPRDGDGLLQWLFVELVDRGRRANVFMHPSVDGCEGSPELVLRLQGVIEETNMGVFGDWDQTEANAKKAMQKLLLCASGCREAFVPQVKALEDIRQTVSMMAGVCPKRASSANTIVLRRRVFTKVNADTPASIVAEDEDPSGLLNAMADKWRITSRARCGYEDAEGAIENLHGLSLRPGDFVDVAVTVVGVIVDGPGGKRCDVIFEPKTVVRLGTADVVEDTFKAEAQEAAKARRRPATPRVATDGFVFTEKRRKIGDSHGPTHRTGRLREGTVAKKVAVNAKGKGREDEEVIEHGHTGDDMECGDNSEVLTELESDEENNDDDSRGRREEEA